MSSIYQHLPIVTLLVIIYSCFVYADGNLTIPIRCLPDQASALLKLKRSFYDPNLSSWQAGTDCCLWEGVACDAVSDRVITLDLGERDLQSRGLDSALFTLTSLRNLSLGNNGFMQSHLPALGFERLTELIHLNLSYNNFIGQIPIGIARLTNLVVLDLSYNYYLYSYEPSFRILIANLSNLKELYLDEVDISSNGAAWSSALAESVPQLRVLSLEWCRLSGPIHPSLSRLHSLVVINLRDNDISGRVPEFFADFSSLSTLRLHGNDFEGQFPPRILQLKSLRILDVSFNSRLSGHLPNFPVESHLEELNLAGTNFSDVVPSSFGNLKSLKLLGLSTGQISKEHPSLVVKLESLDTLLLFGSGLLKPNPSWIGTLKYLRDLELFDYGFPGPIPSWIGNLTNLATLQLSNCNFSGTIPSWIGNLTQLSSLDLLSNNLHGTIPSWIGNLTQLSSLDLSFNNLHGTIPSSIGNLTHLQLLYLWNNNLSGTIPSWIGNLSQLQFLDLSSNNLSGEILKSLFTLPALQELSLRSNSLSGSLQDFSTLSSSIVYIDLSSNKLSGSIPKSFFQLIDLEELDLGSNNLVGTVDLSSFWRLRNLFYLSLSNNMLSVIDGEGNSFFPSLRKFKSLCLASCNLTELPSVLRYLDELYELDLSCNQINGVIPGWIWEAWKDSLELLNLSHNMFTSVEQSPSLIPMSYLSILDLSFNRLQGNVPIPLIDIHTYAGYTLDYSNNKLSFVLPNFTAYLSQTIYLNLSKNKLNGHIPSSICSASNLQLLDLSHNNFSGVIPSCLIEGGNVSILKLRENHFQGMLPQDIREGCRFQTIDLHNNQIEGKLPRSLSNCNDLELLDIGNNCIVDTFPSSLGNLPKLRVLVLRSNRFYGPVGVPIRGDRIGKHFSSLQIIDLAYNNLFGSLHPQWFENLESMTTNSIDDGQVLGHTTNLSILRFYQDTVIVTFKELELLFTKILTTFKVIDFSNNAFDGVIPESIGRLVSLHGLNMSHNAFTGQIPSQLGGLAQLESLDLSQNQLSGEIPRELTSLTYLEWLNLSYNNLFGRIPQREQFLTFTNRSFEGNAGLCGSPLSKQCNNSSSKTPSTLVYSEPNSWSQDRIGVILLFVFVGLGFGMGFAMAILFQVVYGVKGWSYKHFPIR